LAAVLGGIGRAQADCGTDNNKAVFALYQTYKVSSSSDEIDVHLGGFSTNNRKTRYRVTALPATGKVYQPTQVYCDYQYTPKANVALAGGDLPHVVTCASTSVVYKPAANMVLPREGPVAVFSYKTEEYQHDTCSDVANVYLLNADNILAASFFDRSGDGWTVVQNGPTSGGAASYDASSRGAALNRYIYGEEELINLSTKEPGVIVPGSDQTQWYFNAPAKFVTDMTAGYGGTLEFTLGQAAGDFTDAAARVSSAHLVRLECATCKTQGEDTGIQLSYQLAGTWDGATKTFSIPLSESSWLKDPENSNSAWAAPTQCEMYQVLHRLSGLQILGDLLTGHESVMLDSVKLKAPASSTNLRGVCYADMHTFY